MIDEIRNLLDRYANWLKDQTSLREVDKDWVEITTPYLDRNNDHLQIYARRDNGNFLLTDDGYTVNDLELCGCTLDTPKRKELLNMTLNGFGIKADANSLQAIASDDNFSVKKHNLIQAMLAVNDLFFLAQPTVKSLFYEDVQAWMETNEIRYTPRVKFTGKTGYDFLFDFVIPKSKKHPERIVQAISKPDRNTASNFVMAWFDTRDTRPDHSAAYAMLNDTDREIPTGVSDALTKYDVHPVPWSKRDDVGQVLVA